MRSPKIVRKLENSIPIIIKTGKVILGANYVLWSLKNEADKIKAIIVSRNPPHEFIDNLNTVIKEIKNRIPIIYSMKTNIELGDLCGRPHAVSAMAIYSLGSAAISEDELNE